MNLHQGAVFADEHVRDDMDGARNGDVFKSAFHNALEGDHDIRGHPLP